MLIGLSTQDFRSIRKMIIEMILATDMSKHFEKFGAFKVRNEVSRDLDLDSHPDKMLVYSIILKSADIGHTAKPLELHQVWTYKVVEEFYCQGDLEREHSLPISMYCDRLTTDLAKSLNIELQRYKTGPRADKNKRVSKKKSKD